MSKIINPHRQSGLTLIELLVAIAILGIIAVLGWKGLDSIIFSQKELSNSVDDIRNLQLIFAQLQTDCANISNPNKINGRSPINVDVNSLAITRDTYSNLGMPKIQLIKYYLINEKLFRSASEPTRQIHDLHKYWSENQTSLDKNQILLHENVSSIRIRLWNKISQKWQSYFDIRSSNLNIADNDTIEANSQLGNYKWTGLAIDIRLNHRKSDITKVVFLGPS